MIFGGEGAFQQWDIFIPKALSWKDTPGQIVDEETRNLILKRITVAIQWMGISVGFFDID